MVRGESNWVMEFPWLSKRVMFRTVLASVCWLEELFKELPRLTVSKVVLAWLLKLGGTKRNPTPPSVGSVSSTNPVEVRLEGKKTVKGELLKKGEVVDLWRDELIDKELLSEF